MREIVLDTETTGLDPKSGHRIVEIGCVEMVDKIKTGNYFHKYINPQRDMPIEAYRVHGLSAEFLKDKELFGDIVDEFIDFIGGSKLVIHNAKFDMKFLNYELQLQSKELIPMTSAIDSLLIARKKFPGSPANLDSLCRRFKIDLSKRKKHGALLDAELLAEVYLELCGGAQTAINFAKKETEDLKKIDKQVKVRIPSREFSPSEEDLENHNNFISSLKNPIWSDT